MSLEEQRPAVSGPPGSNDSLLAAGIGMAAQWGEALGGTEKLHMALNALEPELQREHEIKVLALKREEAAAKRKAAAEEAEAARKAAAVEAQQEREAAAALAVRDHTYRMRILYASVLLSLAMLGGGIYTIPLNAWIAAGLCGPSLLALVKILFLGRSDASDMRTTSRLAREAGAGGPPPPGTQPPMA
ncbi:hypothetical protein [Streptomyces sp. V1I6]|uniref:hypothetical protein n=1 Tax=Streptomyces sp. V1I6 TaxID=3042273 RepID=UPI002781CC0D|nr:hypothetical protein [Streptomyces sp. V1I6]MDQ0840325.1 hypothetical protein [Streptomyces sp. V1I6]